MKTHILASLCLLAVVPALSAHEFTDLQGRKLEAEILAASGGQVMLKRASDGRTFNVVATSFTPADQKFISDWADANTKYSFEVTYTKKKLNEILAKHTGKSLAQVTKDSDRDNWMTAQEALDYGLVDKIIKSTK